MDGLYAFCVFQLWWTELLTAVLQLFLEVVNFSEQRGSFFDDPFLLVLKTFPYLFLSLFETIRGQVFVKYHPLLLILCSIKLLSQRFDLLLSTWLSYLNPFDDIFVTQFFLLHLLLHLPDGWSQLFVGFLENVNFRLTGPDFQLNVLHSPWGLFCFLFQLNHSHSLGS